MTLDEAICHAKKVAEGQYNLYECYLQHGEQSEYVQNCLKCAAEHRQLAEWLKDYKRLLSDGGVVRIGGKVYRAEKPMLKCITKDGEYYFSGFHEEQGVELVPAERLHGHWLDIPFSAMYECDQCGRKITGKSNFCPKCGADMTEGSDD